MTGARSVEQLVFDCIQGGALGETFARQPRRLRRPHQDHSTSISAEIETPRSTTGQPQCVDRLLATVRGMEEALSLTYPTNFEIRKLIHRAHIDLASERKSGRSASRSLFERLMSEQSEGSLCSYERNSDDALLCVAPIGIYFSNDPGRAFHVAQEAAALFDADHTSQIAAGAAALVVAHLASSMPLANAIGDAEQLVRSFDPFGDIAEALTLSRDPDATFRHARSSSARTLMIALSACVGRSSLDEALGSAMERGADESVLCLTGQLGAIARPISGLDHTDR